MMRGKVNGWLNFAQNWLFKPTCALCGRGGACGLDMCQGCLSELPVLDAACLQCAIPLPVAGVCGQCQAEPPEFDRALAAFRYADPVDMLVQRLKFDGKLYAARLLGELMADRLAPGVTELPQAILPVPLHRSRLRQRGFNQAVELSRALAWRLERPVVSGGCRRIKATPTQTGLDARQRRRNLRDAFEVRRSLPFTHVAVVDDVMTTGATLRSLARVLRRAGVARVDVWVCARAVTG